MRPDILVGTKKGAFILRGDQGFRIQGPHFLGNIVNHMVADPRDHRIVLLAARTGHLGPTVFRSTDRGESFEESRRPPAFLKEEGGRSVGHVFWLTPGNADEPGVWYAGTSPQGLFRSEDGGVTWTGLDGLNRHPDLSAWIGEVGASTPGGPLLHSVLVDPGDSARLYVGMSGGGVFESLDRGETWSPLNRGVAADFLPDPSAEYGHDPHCVVLHPDRPGRLWQQNHCGIYLLDRPSDTWERVGDNMPAEIGDIGFPIALHPRDTDTAWVFPMDGTDVWPRTSPDGRPAVYRTRDAGASWERQDRGLPAVQGWFTVYRQGMAVDGEDPVGVYFGTTGGEIWMSADEGASWRQIAAHLPHVLSVETSGR